MVEFLVVVVLPFLVGVWQAWRDIRNRNNSPLGPLPSLFRVALALGGLTAISTLVLGPFQGMMNGTLVLAGLVVAAMMVTLGAVPAIMGYRVAYRFLATRTQANDPVRRPDDAENPYQSSAF